jgi:hypothetical protein
MKVKAGLCFLKVEKYEDVPAWILTQTKERIAYLQDTLAYLTEKLLTGPLNWLVGTPWKARVGLVLAAWSGMEYVC